MDKVPLIVWQKWADPFGADDDSPMDDIMQSSISESESDTDYFDGLDNEDSEEKTLPIKKILNGVRVIATPMGIIPLTENTASSKIFNFWLGHTNFNITKKVAEIIEETSGVETLDVFTRYRFRIAVGKAFKDSEVMRDINQKLYQESNNVE